MKVLIAHFCLLFYYWSININSFVNFLQNHEAVFIPLVCKVIDVL